MTTSFPNHRFDPKHYQSQIDLIHLLESKLYPSLSIFDLIFTRIKSCPNLIYFIVPFNYFLVEFNHSFLQPYNIFIFILNHIMKTTYYFLKMIILSDHMVYVLTLMSLIICFIFDDHPLCKYEVGHKSHICNKQMINK